VPPVGRKDEPFVFMGLDPGAHGAITVLPARRSDVFEIYKLDNISDLDLLLWLQARTHLIEFAVLERVGGYTGGDGQPGSAMFNFGRGYGKLEMGLTAANIPYEAVQPQKWQKALGIPPRDKDGESKPQFKRRLKAKAEAMFGRGAVRITLENCDALLIAEYCRRTRR
jgi:hypothetical protein